MSRKGRIILACSIPTLLLLIFVAWLFWPRYIYHPTGDELYDRCARLVLGQYKEQESQLRFTRFWKEIRDEWVSHRDYPEIDWTPVLAWEEEFGEDPRYWQLLHQVELLRDAQLFQGYTVKRDLYDFDRNVQRDQDTLYTGDCVERLEELNLTNARSYFPLPLRSVSVADEEQALRLADFALANDADNSYYYYQKADLLVGLGEVEQAWEMLNLGNTSQDNYCPWPFPQRECLQEGQSTWHRGNKLAASLLFKSCGGIWQLKQVKEAYKETSLCCFLGFPVEFADDQIIRAKRLGQMDDVDRLTQITASVMAMIVINDVSEELIDMTPQNTAELQVIDEQMSDVFDFDRQASHDSVLDGILLPDDSWANPLARWEARDYLKFFDEAMASQDLVDSLKPCFDCLDPSPLARWARGETMGEGSPNSVPGL